MLPAQCVAELSADAIRPVSQSVSLFAGAWLICVCADQAGTKHAAAAQAATLLQQQQIRSKVCGFASFWFPTVCAGEGGCQLLRHLPTNQLTTTCVCDH